MARARTQTPENRPARGSETVEVPRRPDGTFPPGVSGNPGGRPRSMTSVILALCPTVSEDLTKFWLALIKDKASTIKKKYGANPTLYDRRAAATELADRVHGRPVQAIEIDERPDVPAFVLPAETPGVNVH